MHYRWENANCIQHSLVLSRSLSYIYVCVCVYTYICKEHDHDHVFEDNFGLKFFLQVEPINE